MFGFGEEQQQPQAQPPPVRQRQPLPQQQAPQQRQQPPQQQPQTPQQQQQDLIPLGTLTVVETENGRQFKGYYAGENQIFFFLKSPQVRRVAIMYSKIVAILFYESTEPEMAREQPQQRQQRQQAPAQQAQEEEQIEVAPPDMRDFSEITV